MNLKLKNINYIFLFLFVFTAVKAQTVDQILEKHINKIGGKQAWGRVNSIQLQGTFNSTKGEEEINSINIKGKFVGYKTVNGKNTKQFVFDGKEYWGVDSRSKKLVSYGNDMSFRSKKSANEFPSMLIQAKELGYKIELLGIENIMGSECYKLKINRGSTFIFGKKEEDVVISFIDKTSFLEVLKEERYIRGSLDTMMYMYYDDYKSVNGVLLPFVLNWFIDDVQLSIKVKSYLLNQKLDENQFSNKEL